MNEGTEEKNECVSNILYENTTAIQIEVCDNVTKTQDDVPESDNSKYELTSNLGGGDCGNNHNSTNLKHDNISCEDNLMNFVETENSNCIEPKNNDEEMQHFVINVEEEKNKSQLQVTEAKSSDVHVYINKPLCADYSSGSDTDTDSEPDSDSETDSDSDSDTDSSESSSSDSVSSSDSDETKSVEENKKSSKTQKSNQSLDLALHDLPPIENLKISVPEEECQEIGVVSSIVQTLVVIQAHKESPPLDIDTVLFLDNGQTSLGKVFDVLGPVSEPVYTVRFNNNEEITENNVKVGIKVYCAPKTQYTSFVFVSELMKMRGSDASWKNNEEAPPECQDFSDDEEEHKFKKAGKNPEQTSTPTEATSRKKLRAFGSGSGGYNINSATNQRIPRFVHRPRCVPPHPRNQNVAGPRFQNNPFFSPVRPPFPNYYGQNPWNMHRANVPYAPQSLPYLPFPYQQGMYPYPNVILPPPPPPPPPPGVSDVPLNNNHSGYQS